MLSDRRKKLLYQHDEGLASVRLHGTFHADFFGVSGPTSQPVRDFKTAKMATLRHNRGHLRQIMMFPDLQPSGIAINLCAMQTVVARIPVSIRT